MLGKLYVTFRADGVAGVLHAARRVVRPPRARCLELCTSLLAGRHGLEIGGPSGVFRAKGLLPCYGIVGALDNCNFAQRTTWQGEIAVGWSYRFAEGRPPGRQYVGEATDLSEIASASYEFLLSSHVLEHTANPLRALHEWTRVLSEDGVLILLVPHRDATFDHRRPVTTLEHLVQDFERGTGEDDQTHLEEIMRLHDLRRDPAAGTAAQFRRRSVRNLENRCLHHHVFDTALLVRLLDSQGLQLLAVEAARPNHSIAIARKSVRRPDNAAFLASDARWRRASPFRTDRHPQAAERERVAA